VGLTSFRCKPIEMLSHRLQIRWRTAGIVAAAICALVFAPSLRAQDMAVNLDPAATQIAFTLGATMHTVHGTFKLKSGHILFDPKTGKASGAVIVDATSGNTDNASRDKKMHADVLESAKFPEIVFTPAQEKGSVSPQGPSRVEISGTLRLHGQDRPMTIEISVQAGSNGQIQASTKFAVLYGEWGLKNPSTFLLHVSDTVNLDIQTTGQISEASAPR
jgi:polyisoprenoid-binding protein YceI